MGIIENISRTPSDYVLYWCCFLTMGMLCSFAALLGLSYQFGNETWIYNSWFLLIICPAIGCGGAVYAVIWQVNEEW